METEKDGTTEIVEGSVSYAQGKIIGIEIFDLGTQLGISWQDNNGKRHAFRLDLPIQLKPDWEEIFKWHVSHPVGNGELEKGDRQR